MDSLSPAGNLVGSVPAEAAQAAAPDADQVEALAV